MEIILGHRWTEGWSGERIRRREAGEGGIDFSRILDTVDVIVDGASLSATAGEDAVFLLMGDVMAGCEMLARGQRRRIALPFYESPWELVLAREGDEALVSLYRGGSNPRIEAKDRRVPLAALLESVVQAGDGLARAIEALDPQVVLDPFVSEMMGAVERLRALGERSEPAGAGEVLAPRTLEGREPSGDEALAFPWRLDATQRDLLGEVTPNRSDLYALMAEGRVACEAGGRRLLDVGGYPVFMIESLLEVGRVLLASLEEGRDLDAIVEGDRLRIDARIAAGADQLTVTLASVGPEPEGAEPDLGPAVLASVPPLVFVEAVLAAASDLVEAVTAANPGQAGNLKLERIASETQDLTAWKRDLTDAAMLNDEPAQLRWEVARPTVPRKESDGNLLATRRLMYAKRWEAEAEGLRLDATFLCGDRVVLCTRSVMAALDRESGEPIWRRDGLPGRSLALMTGPAGLLAVTPSGEVSLVDIEAGSTLWTTRIPPPPGKPAGIAAGGGRRPRHAVITSGENGLVAMDLFTGETRWRFRTRRGMPSGFARAGRFVTFTSRTNAVHCLDVDTGDLVWRFTERSRFELPPANLREDVALWATEHQGDRGRLILVDGLTGQRHWEAPAEGRPLSLPVASGDRVVVPLVRRGLVDVEAWEIGSGDPCWTHETEAPEGPVALLAVDRDIIVHTAGGAVQRLDGATGAPLWSRELSDGSDADLPLKLEPVLRHGGLFVPWDTTYVLNPVDGTLLHRLDEEGPVPDLLRVDEDFSIYTAEVSGHLSAWGVVGHLNVVRG